MSPRWGFWDWRLRTQGLAPLAIPFRRYAAGCSQRATEPWWPDSQAAEAWNLV